MKIIDRYLLREIIPPFILGICIFTFVLLMSQILRLMELIVNKGVGVFTVIKLILYLLPSILVLTVPLSVFLTCIVVFGRWSADNELTAIKSGGLSLLRISLPVLAFSIATYALTSYLIVYALPSGNQAFRRSMFEIVRTKASVGLREKVFNDEFSGLIIYVNHIPQTANPVMKGIVITDYRPEKRTPPQEPLTIIAEEGWLVIDEATQRVIFRLSNGGIHSLARDLQKYQKTDFFNHDIQLHLSDEMVDTGTVPKGLREMTLGELFAKAEEYREQGVRSNGPRVEIHKKFAIPFATLIFGYLGVSMGVLFRRGEKFVSFAVSIAIAIIYYVFLLAGEPLGKQGVINPFLSMWMANFFFAGLAALLLRNAVREKHYSLSFRPAAVVRFFRDMPAALSLYLLLAVILQAALTIWRVHRYVTLHPDAPVQAFAAALLARVVFFSLWAIPAAIMFFRRSTIARLCLVGLTFPLGLLLLSEDVKRYFSREGHSS